MLRIATSGCVGVCIVSAKVSVQFAPPACSSPVSEGICGRLSRMRIACPLSSGSRLTLGDDRAALAADRLDIDRLGGIEHQPQGIGAAKQRRRRRGGKRKTSGAGRRCPHGADRGGAVAGLRLPAAAWLQPAVPTRQAVVFCGSSGRGRRRLASTQAPASAASGSGGCFRRRLGLDLDIGLFGDRLRRRLGDLAGLPRRRGFGGGLLGRGRRDRRGRDRCRRGGYRHGRLPAACAASAAGDDSADGFSACWKATSMM